MASENKIVLIGDPEVGKTSIFTRFKSGQWTENVESQTRKEADCEKKITVDGKEVVVSVQADHVGLLVCCYRLTTLRRAW